MRFRCYVHLPETADFFESLYAMPEPPDERGGEPLCWYACLRDGSPWGQNREQRWVAWHVGNSPCFWPSNEKLVNLLATCDVPATPIEPPPLPKGAGAVGDGEAAENAPGRTRPANVSEHVPGDIAAQA